MDTKDTVSKEGYGPLTQELKERIEARRKPPLVLIVDDDVMEANMNEEFVRGAGCEAIAAHTGEIAIQMVGELKPALVLVDLKLPPPGINGALGLAGDAISSAQTIPFPIEFYGKVYSEIFVGANGLLGFRTNALTLSVFRLLVDSNPKLAVVVLAHKSSLRLLEEHALDGEYVDMFFKPLSVLGMQNILARHGITIPATTESPAV